MAGERLISFGDEMDAVLRAESKRRGCSAAALVRGLVADEMERRRPRPAGDWDPAGRLVDDEEEARRDADEGHRTALEVAGLGPGGGR